MKITLFVIGFIIETSLCIEHDFKGFDDSILFSINWPGPREKLDKLLEDGTTDSEPVINQNHDVLKVLTSHKESYECHIPSLITREPMNPNDYNGPSALELLKPLFTQKICSYRLESYWSYEVCHGKYVKQYHEDRDAKVVRTQEYYLGHWTDEKQKNLEMQMEGTSGLKIKPKTTKLFDVALPSVEMVFEDGSLCDLNGRPRITRVQYVCYMPGKHEIHSFKESSTCEYEIVILSPLLCDHPLYKPAETEENNIDCVPVDDAPKKPRGLLLMEAEDMKFQHQAMKHLSSIIRSISNIKGEGQTINAKEPLEIVLKYQKIEKDGMTQVKFELFPYDEAAADPRPARRDRVDVPVKNLSPVRAFLNGESCLYGGTGWWKYEFCYGRHVSQYHMSRGGQRTSVYLGNFDEEKHLAWIRENPGKAPKGDGKRTSISHFYSNGDVCDLTGQPRQTEVKLKCLENASSAAQVSLYLLEPKTCEYILGVESPLICEVLQLADETGLIKTKLFEEFMQNLTSETDTVEKNESDKTEND